MAITFFGSASVPTADNGTNGASSGANVTPPASMQAGDLVYVVTCVKSGGATFTIANAAGQSWTSLTSFASQSNQAQAHYCTFNGTWGNATVNFTSSGSTAPLTVLMVVFRPTPGWTWSVHQAQTTGSVPSPANTTMTATGVTTTVPSTVTIDFFGIDDDNTCSTPGGGFTIATFGGANQVRNLSGTDNTGAMVYEILSAAAATGNATLVQAAIDPYAWSSVTFAETSPISGIVMRLSGGASNNDPAASIGGAVSSNAAPTALFDDVSSGEASAGDTEYRCVYVYNPTAGAMHNVSVRIDTNTPSAGTTVALGLGAAATGSTETAVANESTAPASVTFSTPGIASELFIGSIPASQGKALWTRRTVTAGASAATDDSVVILVGDDADSDANAYIARMSTQPDATRIALISAFFIAVKAGIGLAKFDAIYLFAAHTSQAALLNLKGTSFTANAVNSPTFTTDSGFNGAGSDGRLDTGFNPATGGSAHLQNDSHIGAWSLTAAAQSAGALWGQASSTNLSQIPRFTDNLAYYRHHSTADDTVASTDGSGHWVNSRGSSANFTPYRNGASLGAETRTSAAPNSSNVLFLDMSGDTSWAGRIAAGHIGGNLTAAEVSALYSALLAYLQGVGAV